MERSTNSEHSTLSTVCAPKRRRTDTPPDGTPVADWIPLPRCLCCGNADLAHVIDLGQQVPANAVHDGERKQKRYPLQVGRCTQCGHFQLDRSISPVILFRDYPYATGISASMCSHLARLADFIGPNKRVLEIGCNDGTLLKACRARGCTVMGVEPSASFTWRHEEAGLHVIRAMWSEQLVAGEEPVFDAVVGTNVLAHLRDPKAALRACDRVLRAGGVAIFEVHRAEAMIVKQQFDTIYHEHLSYFTARSAAALAEGTPFVLTQVMPIDVHGGSFRLVYSRSNAYGNVRTFTEDEQAIETATATYQTAIARRREALLRLIRPDAGAFCIGASARATVMLQSWKPPIAAVVDDEPAKCGRFAAGTEIPIFPFSLLEKAQPRQVLLGAWNLYDTFRPRLAKILPDGAELVSYQPEVRKEVLA